MTIPNMQSKLIELAMDRIEEVGKILCKETEYEFISGELSKIHEEIAEALPEDKRKLVSTFEEKSVEHSTLLAEALYKQGLKDGLQLGHICL